MREAGIAAAKRIDGVILYEERRAPDVWLVGFGDNSLNFELVIWVTHGLASSPGRTQARCLWALEHELRARNIQIPFPQRDLHIRSGGLRVELSPSEHSRSAWRRRVRPRSILARGSLRARTVVWCGSWISSCCYLLQSSEVGMGDRARLCRIDRRAPADQRREVLGTCGPVGWHALPTQRPVWAPRARTH